ncbi:acyl-CoA dehydrogenase [Streptomyces rapamycinicus NRRL 5491]|uniref:Acyl-CoA dehydrogenase n=2 Tax=Streptomyces rapamycinicus TaxID=1226757 RepID=A0A0A0N8L3_STRRN|nr:acyl-CoA dehydrogenase family protein [Streptomyces rapamycinicus]AGP55737.1 acyl-CoA dehydrogenase [Streptomyces rapamycinicus NRRL 5491]MBB4783302.1 alkylation response protein AidB-like acyl-CoA dehydrogenase [Streptomyces rapamycinicus]RLV81223.1 acyl-CoA dehydrogenase [Streptomyces rapamycinicus NRRL 5491]UTO63712.1 acyl-CoA/acyl-ACP dehydrogenase [Streptomyces rapamycinicus]
MDFQLTDDQRALRTGMRELLERRFPRTRLRAVVDGDTARGDGDTGRGGALDRELWRELGAAGLFALRVAESAGGVGLGLPEVVLAFEEAGRALLPGPLVATELAAGLSGSLAAGAAQGETVVTALDEGGAPVEYLASADVVLALGPTAVEVIPAAEVARSAEPMRSVDPATPLHRTAPSRTRPDQAEQMDPADRMDQADRTAQAPRTAQAGTGRSGPAARLRREAALLTAAQQLGSASRTVELAVDHAKHRTQFGRPIGAFQAVQHLCAQMLVRAESARSVVYAAAVTEDPGDIAAAKLLADEAAVHNARDCLQVHGGMGFTWEADVHLHLKRAWVRAGQWQSGAAAEEELAAGLVSTVETCL